MQRIPHGRKNAFYNDSRPVVYLQHGLLGDATNFLTNLVDQSLGYILADAGYDVWLGNCRGTTYSKNHISLSPERKEFWEFSWDEMAKYDLPAFINYALNVSGQSQLYYIGHSQGTTIAFAAFSQNRELGKKVKLFTALAPVATVGYNESPIRFLADENIYKGIEVILNTLGIHEFLPHSKLIEYIGNAVCGKKETVIICEVAILLIGGFDCNRMNASRVPVYVSHTPAGTSVQNMAHWSQMIKSGKFQMYDYGIFGNIKHYNRFVAPVYDVRKMKVPVAVFSGDWDALADPKDVELLIPKLKSLVYSRSIPKFDHIDFIWAVDAATVLYKDVIKLLQKY
ncbi:gastric triacylglycerol lipase-like isoform X2 [Ptychodera flava]